MEVLEVDTCEALAQRVGLLRPLVRHVIEKHFADFGLEFVSHNTMRGLSGGQQVKIVLGAATWHRPHVMCLDEFNSEFFRFVLFHSYTIVFFLDHLDCESLAALIVALKVFEGGV